MTRDHNLNLRPVLRAALAASLLMLMFGAGYHVLAARLAAPGDATPVDPALLAQFPLQIGDWTGVEAPIDEEVVRATDTDAHLSRRYSRGNDLETIWFYVASGVRARDLMPHRPEVCYTGAGWTLVGRRSTELPLGDGMELPVNVMRFSRGALNKQGVLVLDYYIVDGQYCADISLLRSKAWRGSGAVGYVAQVQIVAPVTTILTAEAAQALVSDFAVESASPILRLFESAEATRAAADVMTDSEGGGTDESN